MSIDKVVSLSAILQKTTVDIVKDSSKLHCIEIQIQWKTHRKSE